MMSELNLTTVMHLAFLLGRTPELAQKEIEATATILPFQWSALMVQPNIMLLKASSAQVMKTGSPSDELLHVIDRLQRRLGGATSIARLIEAVGRGKVLDALEKIATDGDEDGKVDFGISYYGTTRIGNLGLPLKKRLKAADHSARYVAPKEGNQLNSAQVLRNRLAAVGSDGHFQTRNKELVVIEDGGQFWVGYTLTVQDIDSYSRRDFGLPVSDSLSGMLPPKLAQTMINLAMDGRSIDDTILYDPFCGNGRIVLEARLMGIKAYGSDIDSGKVSASVQNLDWLANQYFLSMEQEASQIIWQHDACKPLDPQKFNQDVVIAGEPYLGRPLRQPLPKNQQTAWLQELAGLYEGFLKTYATDSGLKPKRFVLVFPAAKLEGGGEASLYAHLVDRLASLGYSSSIQGRYSRPDSLVCRDIVSLIHG